MILVLVLLLFAGSDKQGPTGSFFFFSILGWYGSGFKKKLGSRQVGVG